MAKLITFMRLQTLNQQQQDLALLIHEKLLELLVKQHLTTQVRQVMR